MKLFSTAYFPPISYFAQIADGMTLSHDRVIPSEIVIEACEHYQKQSYRNRCYFYADNGAQYLQVPVIHDNGTHELPIREIRIDYSTAWLTRSERALDSAYESSAFFEYYRDDLYSILDSKPERLFDLNMSILLFFLEKTGVKADIRFTEEYRKSYSEPDIEDLREAIHPKRKDSTLNLLSLEKPYFQVFARKYGFIENLSIMDLLFNEGPESILYLKNLHSSRI